MKHPNQIVLAVVITGFAGAANAAGYALIEQNVSGLGNAYAGQAASAQDASTVFFNPAGMTLLPARQLVLAAHIIKPTAEFSGAGGIGGGTGGDIGDYVPVPNAYFALKLTPDVHLGIGLNSPFGLRTEYDATWLGRAQAIESDLKTINLNPSLAWKANEQLSVGAGLSVQWIDVELSSFAGANGIATVKGDDYGWGFNLGALWNLGNDTRIGLAYRSSIDYSLEGTVSFSLAPPGNGPVNADATMPDSASLSLFHKINPQLDVLADVTWTGWSEFDQLRIVRTSGAVVSFTPENWNDNYRYSLGANYHKNEKVTWRFGVAFDETPVPDAFRTPRIPDEDRTWIAIGGQYRLSRQGAIDVGYAHLFVKDASLNSPATGTAPASPLVTGDYDASVDMLSVQYTHTF
jgi:long-chain fatty acid transport protein